MQKRSDTEQLKCYISGMWWKRYSPGWSAQYSGSGPSGRRRKCRRGRSCSVSAAEIRDQTFRQSASSCLLSTQPAAPSAKWSDWRSCWRCFAVIYSHSGLARVTTDTSSEMRGAKNIQRQIRCEKKSWKVCNNSNGLYPRCQSWGTGLHVTGERRDSAELVRLCKTWDLKHASKPPSFQ